MDSVKEVLICSVNAEFLQNFVILHIAAVGRADVQNIRCFPDMCYIF